MVEEKQEEVAGRDLDAAITERVMGWRTSIISAAVWHSEAEHDSYHKDKFRPSESMGAAMQVVEKVVADGFHWEFSCHNPSKSRCDGRSFAEFWHYTNGAIDVEGSAEGATLPVAICRAALASIDSQ